MTDPRSDRFIRSRLKTRHLVLLKELGQHQSILRAAEAANLTQPAASKLLSELEETLGVTLFERLPRGVSPTWYGEVMIRRASAALAEMSLAHQEVMELLSGMSGRVSIGTVLTPATSLLPQAVRMLKARHERVHVAIEVDASKPLVERLRAGQLDFVVGRILDHEAVGELSFEPLADEPHRLIARAGHPLCGREGLAVVDLADEGWILPPAGSILRDRITAMFVSHGLDLPHKTVETTALPLTLALLVQSDMIVALPEAVVRAQLDAGTLAVLPIDPGLRLDAYGIVTRRQHTLSPGAQAMLDVLREVASGRQD
ncbi:LysR substrate-binding domain-containing protein [Ideonella sp.]|uniref:LysR substrate-binding domain-containing protein n=1 Tax=Ideonella sp. TaxID=1929293 RepID=UPI002B481B39|nr:LysR substrate-binding domain-containing protein [Ideonella sp.]HJV71771.1 LysR substrate-binding domain-containing protein [Ideonella sp.]